MTTTTTTSTDPYAIAQINIPDFFHNSEKDLEGQSPTVVDDDDTILEDKSNQNAFVNVTPHSNERQENMTNEVVVGAIPVHGPGHRNDESDDDVNDDSTVDTNTVPATSANEEGAEVSHDDEEAYIVGAELFEQPIEAKAAIIETSRRHFNRFALVNCGLLLSIIIGVTVYLVSTRDTNPKLPSEQLTANPSTNLTNGSDSLSCFESSYELHEAVVAYLDNNDDVKQKYGEQIGSWCVGAVNDFSFLFCSCEYVNADGTKPFYNPGGKYFNEDISQWNTSSATIMMHMFDNAAVFNQSISNWDVSSVTNMDAMFLGASSFNQDLSLWDVSAVTSMSQIFRDATAFDQDISSWDVSSVTKMDGIFLQTTTFNGNISLWNVSSATDMTGMFNTAKNFDQDLHLWDVSSVTNMIGMFLGAENFNGNISSWDVSAVTDMSGMFLNAKAFDQDVSSWDVSSVLNMYGMFLGAESFNTNISTWNVSAVTSMAFMFVQTLSFNQNLCPWGEFLLANETNTTDMFYFAGGCPTNTNPDLTATPPGPFCYPCS